MSTPVPSRERLGESDDPTGAFPAPTRGIAGAVMGATTLKLLDTKTFSSGVVALHYQPLESSKKR